MKYTSKILIFNYVRGKECVCKCGWPWRPEEDVRSLGAGLTGNHEQPDMMQLLGIGLESSLRAICSLDWVYNIS